MARVCKYGLSWVWTAKPRAFCVLWVATILCSFKLHRQECLLILRRFLRVCLCLRKLVTECLLVVDSGGDIVRKKKRPASIDMDANRLWLKHKWREWKCYQCPGLWPHIPTIDRANWRSTLHLLEQYWYAWCLAGSGLLFFSYKVFTMDN